MPGFDGTGPMGLGPMTGGGRGFCAMPYGGYRPGYRPYGYGFQTPYYPPPVMNPFYGQSFYSPFFGAGRGGIPWGGGRGRAFGGGRGFRRWWW